MRAEEERIDMERTGETLAAVGEGLAVMYERYARLLDEVEDTSVPVPGLDWTVRETAVHVSGAPLRYGALASGDLDLSAVPGDKQFLDARMRSLIADNAETDAKKLADQTREALAYFLSALAVVAPDQAVAYYAGHRPAVVRIAAALLGEPIVHGYDIATAVGVPWPIDPEYAALAVAGYRAAYPVIFQPSAAAGLEATYRIEIPGTEAFSARIAGDAYEELPASGPPDCEIAMDPVAALLVITGRLSRWAGIALGGITFGGDRRDLGPRFFDLFVFP
jgi:uncharacterized protein (TIGR03083 family)